VLTDAHLAPIVAEARALWTRALGAGDTRMTALDTVQVVVGSLPEGRLGVTLGHQIFIDYNAAGYGWFTDGSLGARVEAGRMDLLTVVAHELGNAMGFAEDPHATSAVTTPSCRAERGICRTDPSRRLPAWRFQRGRRLPAIAAPA